MTHEQEQAIRRHGENLQAIFPATRDADPVALCKRLRRIERAANQSAVAYCNGDIDCGQWEAIEDKTLDKLDRILGFVAAGVPVFVNGDPRGYALKIEDGWLRDSGTDRQTRLYRDWGGYGIIAPEIGPNGS